MLNSYVTDEMPDSGMDSAPINAGYAIGSVREEDFLSETGFWFAGEFDDLADGAERAVVAATDREAAPIRDLATPDTDFELRTESDAVAVSGDEALWRAVICEALLDATLGIHDGTPGGAKRMRAPTGKWLDLMDEARDWFRDGGEDFELVCECASLDPREVRQAARDAIDTCEARRRQKDAKAVRREIRDLGFRSWSPVEVAVFASPR